MEYIIIGLIIIVFILFMYIFISKRELKRIKKELVIVKNSDTNLLVHTEANSKEINEIVKEINTLMADIKTKEIDIDRKHKILTKMMTNISHDLRTPLTSALGYINIIINSDLSKDEQYKELKIIEERLKRLEELIDSFFEFSKIISNDKKIIVENINLVGVIEESVAHYYDDYVLENRQIIFNVSDKKISILSDKMLLMRIFDNLINNALKHSNSNLEINLYVDDKINITFTNDLAINNLDINKIFDEFYTVDIARTKSNNGLGLAIVKEFTECLGGNISAKKENNQLKIIIEFETNKK